MEDPRVQGHRPIRVLVADDNPVVLAGLRALLDGRPDVRVVAEARDGREAVELARRSSPDVVLLDIRMPGVDGLQACRELSPGIPVVMLTYSTEPEVIREAFAAGAIGYLVHGRFGTEDLVAAVRDGAAGLSHLSPAAASVAVRLARDGIGRPSPAAHGLSPRELEVMALVGTGLTNTEVAAALFLSEKTVKNHLTRIFDKLGARSRAEAVAIYVGAARPPG